MLKLDGLIAATPVPMTGSGEIDEQGLQRYINWIVEEGVAGIAVNADTGEPSQLNADEKNRIVEIVREALPDDRTLVAGVAGPSTTMAEMQAEAYTERGADALMIFPLAAYLSDPLDPRIPIGYHATISEIGTPLILFQLQRALGGTIFEKNVMKELLNLPSVVAVKEASFDGQHFSELVATVRESRPEISVLTGNDNFIYESFILGADGALLGFGSIMTSEQVSMIAAAKSHEVALDRVQISRVQRLANFIYSRPVGNYRARLKTALKMLGLIETDFVRPPLVPLEEHEREIVQHELKVAGLL